MKAGYIIAGSLSFLGFCVVILGILWLVSEVMVTVMRYMGVS